MVHLAVRNQKAAQLLASHNAKVFGLASALLLHTFVRPILYVHVAAHRYAAHRHRPCPSKEREILPIFSGEALAEKISFRSAPPFVDERGCPNANALLPHTGSLLSHVK
eukprot:6486639-Amphidinium_carterae.1